MRIVRITAALALFAALPTFAQPAPTPEWVKRSNENAAILLGVQTRFAPEFASRFGVEGHDADVSQLPLDINQQQAVAMQDAIKQYEAKLATEKDAAVRQDLQILIESAKQNIEGNRINDKYDLPYFNISQLYFLSLSGLLDDCAVAASTCPSKS